MYNMEELLAQLQGGQSADAIAKSFTDALNAAIAEQARAQAEADKRQDKIEWLQDILEETVAFIKEYYPEVLSDENVTVETAEVEELVDMLDETIPQLLQLAQLTDSLSSHIKPVSGGTVTIKAPGQKPATFDVKSADFNTIMNDFFNKHGLN